MPADWLFPDYGYPLYLSVIYFLTGNSILIVCLVKAVLSTLTCVFVYRLAKRNFGEETGRIAAVLCMLDAEFYILHRYSFERNGNVFWCLRFERTDYAMRSSKLTIKNLILPILLAASLFFLRTVLGATALFAFATALMLSTKRTVKGNRLVLISWVLLVMVYFLGVRLVTEIEEAWRNVI